jgi:hypothetical protein
MRLDQKNGGVNLSIDWIRMNKFQSLFGTHHFILFDRNKMRLMILFYLTNPYE